MTIGEAVGSGAADSWERLHPRTVAVTALTMVGIVAVGGGGAAIAVAAATSLGVALMWVLPAAVLLFVVVTGYDLLRVRHTRYRVTPERLELETGLWFRSRRSLARERIRSVDLTADPVSRMLGLVRVKAGTGETGGGEGSTTERSIDLDSLSRAAGERLRVELLRRDGAAPSDGTEPVDERLATWRPGWLRYAPLSFVTPALAVGLAGGIFQVAEWFGMARVPVEMVAGLIARHGPWLVLGLGLVGFLLIGALGSLLLQAESSWGHRLDREPGGTLRVRRGLLVSRSLSLEEQRIRGVEIVEPLGVRMAGAARLDVIAIGLKSADSASDLTTLVPAAPRQVAWVTADAVAGPVDAVGLLPHPLAARNRRLRRAGIATLALAAVVFGVHLLWSPPLSWSLLTIGVAVFLATWAWWSAFDAYASLGHTLDGEYLVTRHGTLRRATVRLRRSGIVGWRIRQSFFQRRLGLVTVEATTAAGRGHYVIIDAAQDEGVDFAAMATPGLLDAFLDSRLDA
ncbi:PH domain-containing protein [Tessaracoccus caeni]|uniref:PH domain-containing protein n=1 Tax=Tessaracoccus caeni TaxID=3031239 RepID=UPI0023DC9AAA|nr:PH domain-containing protein [Tessaracoccus caeni]MDF1488725.1 PH domain-containing protein [Tessaracoccus caeni]